jgi:hypothetical protein|nr:MAG TPA: putative tail component [Caudoviricetes sp.]
MMGKFTIEDFIGRLNEVQKLLPDEAEKVMQTGTNKMKKAIEKRTPITGKNHKNKLRYSWKKRVTGASINTLRGEIYSKAPHFHLVERGHIKLNRKGEPIGFVQGKFFKEKAIDENIDDIKSDMKEKLLRRIKRKLRD